MNIRILPGQQNISAETGSNLLDVLRSAGFGPDAPCGGQGTCGKCRVLVDGIESLACRVTVDRDMTVTLRNAGEERILTDGIKTGLVCRDGYDLALDIGTTTVAGCLLHRGQPVAYDSMPNPQHSFGADVITRIQRAMAGDGEAMTRSIREAAEQMARRLCANASVKPAQIAAVSIVGNPAMQQLFLGISMENLAKIPFTPVLTKANAVPAREYMPTLDTAELLIVPDISGFVGADTVACVLATEMEKEETTTLLVDIGTNGEMVLCHRGRMVACAAAAGPALEGANIHFGMRAGTGAIDHVKVEKGKPICSVIGGGEAVGICGSGIIDAIAVALDMGLINQRGKILSGDRIYLTEKVYLTQEDIRQVQLAKGAIAAGIQLMQQHLDVREIEKVYLAGAFGSYIDPVSACRVGLLPGVAPERIQPVGNAALSGAMKLACDPDARMTAQKLSDRTDALNLAQIPGFQRCFAKNMRF